MNFFNGLSAPQRLPVRATSACPEDTAYLMSPELKELFDDLIGDCMLGRISRDAAKSKLADFIKANPQSIVVLKNIGEANGS